MGLTNEYSEFYNVRTTAGGGVEVQLGNGPWVTPPQLDRDGNQVQLLSKHPEWVRRWEREQAGRGPGFDVGSAQRAKLELAIAEAGVARPPASAARRSRRQR